jgi:membrane protein DedA with SNARE-associated domain
MIALVEQAFFVPMLQEWGPILVWVLLMGSGVGIPLGEDFVLIPTGLFLANNDVPAMPYLIAGYLGVVCSDLLWFVICTKYGVKMLRIKWFKRIFHPKRLLQAKYQIDRRGVWMIFASRFIPASRTSMITVAGMLRMSFWRFAAVTASCVVVTVPLQVGFGYLIGRGLADRSTSTIVTWVLATIVLGAIMVVFGRSWLKHRRSGKRTPRARTRWLRQLRRGRSKV